MSYATAQAEGPRPSGPPRVLDHRELSTPARGPNLGDRPPLMFLLGASFDVLCFTVAAGMYSPQQLLLVMPLSENFQTKTIPIPTECQFGKPNTKPILYELQKTDICAKF